MSVASFAAAQILGVLPRARISHAVGRLADYQWPPWVARSVVGAYAMAFGIDFGECVLSSGWETFDEFFTRALRPGARPVDPEPGSIVSPADGTIDAMARVEWPGRLVVKGREYAVSDLLGDEREARRLSDAFGCVIYLSPRDYHRVHAPIKGTISRIRSMPGDYYPVNMIGRRHVRNLLGRNRRVAIEIETDRGHGRVTVVMVGALIVGRITATGIAGRDVPSGVHVFDPPIRVERGDEIGRFHLGSTVVLFADNAHALEVVQASGDVRCGRPLLRTRDMGLEASSPDSRSTTDASGGEERGVMG